MILEFIKMHGLGNDFIIINNIGKPAHKLSKATIKELCDRNFGVGSDQLVILESCEDADCLMHIYNSDGSKASACGNATRCVAKLLNLPTSVIRVGERKLFCTLHNDSGEVTVNMGSYSVPVELAVLEYSGYFINVGNLHFVCFVDELDSYDVAATGLRLESSKLLPNRSNIGFAEIMDAHTIKLRVWESGAGETFACGTGACASAIVAHKHLGLAPEITVHLKGGALNIAVKGPEVVMRGSAKKVFNGNWCK